MPFSIKIDPSALDELDRIRVFDRMMKTITMELDQFRDHLDDVLAETEHGGVIVTRGGKPWIIVHPVSEDWDAELAALAQSAEFWEMIRERRREVAIPWDEAKRRLSVE